MPVDIEEDIVDEVLSSSCLSHNVAEAMQTRCGHLTHSRFWRASVDCLLDCLFARTVQFGLFLRWSGCLPPAQCVARCFYLDFLVKAVYE